MVLARHNRGAGVAGAFVLAAIVLCCPALAADSIPQESGFGGFFIVAPGVFDISSNLLYGGAPLLDDVANTQIESIFDAPSSQSAAALLTAGELNYTFSSTRTQLYFGNRLEDLLRLDVLFGLGVRQELPDKSIMALSALMTPTDLKVWSDPYVEGEDRVKTDLDQPGARFRWGRMFKTGLEFTAQYRRYEHDQELSGRWLIDEGRLDPADRPLLDRDGDIWKAQFLYRIKSGQRHVFEPVLRYTNWDLDGAAMAHAGPAAQLTYLYLTKKLVLDANVIYLTYEADRVHPVYGQVLTADRYALGLTAFYDLFNAKRWRALASIDFVREDANIDFFDSRVSAFYVGVIWRFQRK